MFTGITEINQRINVTVSDRVYIAASATISTIRATFGNKFFTAKRRYAIAALTPGNFNTCLINEFHAYLPQTSKIARTNPNNFRL